MRIYTGVAKKWPDAVVYRCVSPDFSTRCVDAVEEKDGKIFFRQVLPAHRNVKLVAILGHTGTPLARRAAEELEKRKRGEERESK